MEFARDKILVNCVHPGIVNTPLACDKETGKELVPVDSFAIPRQASPEEIAEALGTFVRGSSYFHFCLVEIDE